MQPKRPRVMPQEPGHPETGGRLTKSGTLRAAIFGANDGLVSNLSLIMGFAGANSDPKIVVLAGVAGLLAGAFSMGAGEYISMHVQRDGFEQLLELERWELANTPDEELLELTGLYEAKGLSPELAKRVATELSRDPDIALDTHAREELGLDPTELGSPWGAAASSFISFALGAMVPLVGFLFGLTGTGGIVVAATLSGIALFSLGASMTIFTGRSWLPAGLRMLGVGAAAATITYFVGSIFDISGI